MKNKRKVIPLGDILVHLTKLTEIFKYKSAILVMENEDGSISSTWTADMNMSKFCEMMCFSVGIGYEQYKKDLEDLKAGRREEEE